MQTSANILRDAALEYAREGFPVFPVHSIINGICTCNKGIKCSQPGKHPATAHGYKDASVDPHKINAWFRQPRNIGISTGKDSGLLVIDIDPPEGAESIKQYEPLPETRKVRTGSGGWHLYFKYPKNMGPIASKAGAIAPKVDHRADCGYIIAPPSVHKSGQNYVWINKAVPLADAPENILKQITISKTRHYTQRELQDTQTRVIPDGRRNSALASFAGSLVAQGHAYPLILKSCLALNEHECSPPLEEIEVESVVKSIMGYEKQHEDAPFRKSVGITDTDVGNAQLFAQEYGETTKFCTSFNQWYIWGGKYWRLDDTDEIARLAVKRAKSFTINDFDIIGAKSAQTAVKQFEKHLRSSLTASRLKAMIQLAGTDENINVPISALDKSLTVLNLENGTLDLTTQQLRPHSREDLLTKILPYQYQPEAECPIFNKFIRDITLNDQEVANYLQKSVGYSLTGYVHEHAIFFLTGGGANGKSTFIEVIRFLLGNYAKSTPMSTFVKGGRPDRIRNDIAGFAGARFVCVVEFDEDDYLDIALLKRMTGGDAINERMLYKEHTEYMPQFKIFFAVNTLPKIKTSNEAAWRRINVIPFRATFSQEDQDKELTQKLKNELPGILNWALIGLQKWQKEGLVPPKIVIEATQAYQEDQDSLGQFIEERCEINDNLRMQSSTFHIAYTSWCKIADLKPLGLSQIIELMEKQKYHRTKIQGTYYYRGIALSTSYHETTSF